MIATQLMQFVSSVNWLPIVASGLGAVLINILYTNYKFKQTQYPNLKVGLGIEHVCPGAPYLVLKWQNVTNARAVNATATICIGTENGTTAAWTELLAADIPGGESGVCKTVSGKFVDSLSSVLGDSVVHDIVPVGSPSLPPQANSVRGFRAKVGKDCPKFYVMARIRWSPPLWKAKSLERVVCGVVGSEVVQYHCLTFFIEETTERNLPSQMTEMMGKL
jgi:hypothetical protein